MSGFLTEKDLETIEENNRIYEMEKDEEIKK